jgi:release factor glutamine methyltransferase
MADGGRLTAAPGLTVATAVAAAREALASAGVADPGREADELYAGLVQAGASAAFAAREDALTADRAVALEAAVRRRAAGEPQAYATGWANFRGHWLRVDRRVLIPRPETEGLVDLVLEWARGCPARGAPRAMDVGTGSGAIAIALALALRSLRVVAVERSAGALALAAQNVAAQGLAERVGCVQGDLLEPVRGAVADVVVSNPPYVATGELAGLDESVRFFEPVAALDGGPDGLGPTRRLAAAARRVLAPGGLFALEVDSRRADASAELVQDAGFPAVAIAYDLFNRPRYVWAEQSGA